MVSITNYISLMPRLILAFALPPQRFFASFQAGYELHITGTFNTTGGNQTNLTAQWDGLRILLGIGIKVGSTSEFDYYQ